MHKTVRVQFLKLDFNYVYYKSKVWKQRCDNIIRYVLLTTIRNVSDQIASAVVYN